MKTLSTILKFSTTTLILTFVFSWHSFAQQPEGDDRKRKVRYISSNSQANAKRPNVRIIKKGTVSRIPKKSEKKLMPTDFRLEKKAFGLINENRIARGLKRLKWSNKAAKLARHHSQNMAKYSFFSHVGKNGRLIDERAVDFGIKKWQAIGENIAYNKGFENPAEFAVQRWMLSSTHKNNLLDRRWKESGIGVGITEDGMYFFTQVFLVK